MATLPIHAEAGDEPWVLPYRGTVGMACLIVAESAIFLIFVIAYLYYIGKSLSGPTPREVLTLPIFSTICLLSSSITVHFACAGFHKGARGAGTLWLASTITLGTIFLVSTGMEWHHLIYHDGLTIQTSLFGTTFYSLVGLHASHVLVGLILLTTALILAFRDVPQKITDAKFTQKLEVLSLYWHFVDAVWVVVFTVVYILGR